jgi:hypothetical protein
MHVQRKPLSTDAEDQRDVRSVFTHLIWAQPDTLRLSDLVLELAETEEFDERDRIERAVRELVKAGLVFRCAGVVLPTRPALRAYELLMEAF